MRKKKEKKIVGWREWVGIPDLDIKEIKAKVDTGARTSSLHAYDIEKYKRGDSEFVKFKVHPVQKSSKKTVECKAKILEYRKVKSSNGISQVRPVIETEINIMGESFVTELTLTNRDEMGFRMLIGRESLRGRFLVDSAASFLGREGKKKK